MITFELGAVHKSNATVTLGEIDHDAFSERDSEGNIVVTVDSPEPDNDEPVSLCLHAENNGTYHGVILVKDGRLTFKAK